MKAFQLLVYAIAALALIAIIMLYIAPFFFPAQDAAQALREGLTKAQLNLGESHSQDITFSVGSQLAENFEASNRNVRFQCNEPAHCCPRGDDCGRIKWDERQASFPQNLALKTTFRCLYQGGLFSCTVYLGRLPAQVKVAGNVERVDFDATAAEPTLSFNVSNEGEVDLENGVEVTLVLSKIVDGEEKEFRFEETKSLEALKAGETQSVGFFLAKNLFREAGEHLVEVRAEAIEGGFDETQVEVNILKVSFGDCQADYQGEAQLIDTGCVKKLYCSGCEFAFQCKSAWQSQLPSANIELGTTEYAYGLLDASQCP